MGAPRLPEAETLLDSASDGSKQGEAKFPRAKSHDC